MTQRPYPGESLVTRFPGAEDWPGGLTVLGLKGDDEGIIDVLCFRWVCDWNQRSEPLLVLNVPAWDRIVKIPAVSDITGPEFAVGMPLWLGPNADFWAVARSFWGAAVGVPLSQKLPNTHQTGEGSHSFTDWLTNICWPSSHVLGTTEKNKGKRCTSSLPSPPAAFWILRGRTKVHLSN